MQVQSGPCRSTSKLTCDLQTFRQEENVVGCWRAHLDLLQHIVHSRIASAIIFEDDADWDVALKYQMTELARGMRFLLNQSEMSTPHSPYGDGWDVVWVGHCSTRPDESDNRRWVVPEDPTVVPPWARSEFEKPDMKPFEDGPKGDSQTRLVFVPAWGSCTAAYAISLKGAEKVLYRQSMLPFNEPVDNGMGSMCRDKTFQFSCISPFPTIVGTSRPAGPKNRLSDIHGSDGDLGVEEHARSESLVFPVRQNIERLFRGDTVFDSQYPNVTGANMSIEEIGRGVGHAEWLQKIEVEEGTGDESIDPELQGPVRAMNDEIVDETNKFWSLSDDPAEGSSPNGEQAYDILETSGEVQEAGLIEPPFFDPLDPDSRSQIAAFEDATYGNSMEDIMPIRLKENPHIHKHGAPTLA